MLPIIRHKGLINLFVVMGCVCVGLGKWKMGKDIGCGYFFKTKNYAGFLIVLKYDSNFEYFCWNISLSANLLFMKSVLITYIISCNFSAMSD